MSKVKQIIRLKENGVGLRAISRSMGISHFPRTLAKSINRLTANNQY